MLSLLCVFNDTQTEAQQHAPTARPLRMYEAQISVGLGLFEAAEIVVR